MTTRRAFLAGASAALAAQADRPNVIFILADDMGWGDLSCYGNTRTKTPHLDKLAAEGTLFTQFYVNGSVCSPSRAAFTTGQFPARNRMHGHLATEELNAKRAMPNFLDPARPTVARAFQSAGYRTAHIGKWHLGNGTGAPLPDAYGFTHHKSVTSNETAQTEQAPGFRAQSTAWMVDRSLEFIRSGNTPFYLQMWTLLPHAPLAPTAEQLAPFARLAPGGDVRVPGAPQTYFASLKDLDDQIGRLLAELAKDGLAQNTIVVFSSDNGPEDIHINNASHAAFGTPGPFRGRKRSLYEGGVRVPFIVRWPGKVPAGRVDDRSVLAGVDFFPTLTKLAGLTAAAPAQIDGEDQSDVLLGKSRPRRTPLFWEWRYTVAGYAVNRSPILSFRDGDWKLLLNPDRSRVELFHIPNDPSELNNLAAAEPARVKAMAERVLAWQKTLPPGPMDANAGRNDWPMPKSMPKSR
jgi:arylsulfatase A-like enzyme